MKRYHCSKCGASLDVKPIALKQYATILHIVQFHTCLETPLTVDQMHLDPKYAPVVPNLDDQKFVQNLEQLNRGTISSNDLRDRREGVRDDATPEGISAYLRQLKETS